MKKLIIAATVIGTLGLGSTVALADGGKHMEQRMARMQQELGLTDEQVAKVKALREAQRTAMQASREAHHQQIEALLTPEQKEKFSAMKEKRKHRMGKRGGHGYKGGRCGGHGKRGDHAAQQS